MAAMKRLAEDLAYEYLRSHNLNDSDENWERAMRAVCEGEDANENAK